MSVRFTSIFLKFLKLLDSRARTWMYILVQRREVKDLFFSPLSENTLLQGWKMSALPPSVWFYPEVLKLIITVFLRHLLFHKIFKAENFKTVPAVRKISVISVFHFKFVSWVFVHSCIMIALRSSVKFLLSEIKCNG